MAEHEPLDIAKKDAADEKPARTDIPRSSKTPDDAAAASEPMALQRLPEPIAKVPPGRQRTGDPPEAPPKK